MLKSLADRHLARTFALLTRAAARRKVYARKAAKQGRPEAARFLRAMAASESVQARRLLNSLIGRIDTSDSYLATVFEKELPEILANYAELIERVSEGKPALRQALSQLRAAEIRLRSFYSPAERDVDVPEDAEYFVCSFCGYLNDAGPPEKCPICGAASEAFHKVA